MPILVKTHQSGTNAYFRLEFDDDKLKLWTEDSSAMITRTLDLWLTIQTCILTNKIKESNFDFYLFG
jgi:hypothetical protein